MLNIKIGVYNIVYSSYLKLTIIFFRLDLYHSNTHGFKLKVPRISGHIVSLNTIPYYA